MKKLIFMCFIALLPAMAFSQASAPESGTENNVKIRHVYCQDSGGDLCYVAFRRARGVVCGGFDWRLSPAMLEMVLANPNGRYNATCSVEGNQNILRGLWLVP